MLGYLLSDEESLNHRYPGLLVMVFVHLVEKALQRLMKRLLVQGGPVERDLRAVTPAFRFGLRRYAFSCRHHGDFQWASWL